MQRVKPNNFSVFGVPRRTNNDLEGINNDLTKKIDKGRTINEFLDNCRTYVIMARMNLRKYQNAMPKTNPNDQRIYDGLQELYLGRYQLLDLLMNLGNFGETVINVSYF